MSISPSAVSPSSDVHPPSSWSIARHLYSGTSSLSRFPGFSMDLH
ncbi:unnamed protein product [Cuscuta epithymum]|uniref:Uncharacterized protein n=1 Tax=Cuscuta epithymum TaxID=186058 RepID=A0AAV0G2R0_9ASTE|nr:unnamed protein product [Cuscuta epithymum]